MLWFDFIYRMIYIFMTELYHLPGMFMLSFVQIFNNCMHSSLYIYGGLILKYHPTYPLIPMCQIKNVLIYKRQSMTSFISMYGRNGMHWGLTNTNKLSNMLLSITFSLIKNRYQSFSKESLTYSINYNIKKKLNQT